MNVTVEHEGAVIDSNTGTEAELRASLGVETPAADAESEVEETESAKAAEKPAATKEAAEAKTKSGNPRHDPRARIAELTREREDAKRERDAERAEALRLRSELESLKKPAAKETTAKEELVESFQFDDFKTWSERPGNEDKSYEEYGDARTDARYAFNKTKETRATEQQTKQTNERDVMVKHHERLTAYRKEHPEYDDDIQRSPVPGIPAPMYVLKAIVRNEHSPALQHHYATHPDEYRRLVTLDEDAAIEAIITLKTQLTAASPGPAEAAKSMTAAKPLIKPVSGSPQVSDEPPGDDASDDEWLRHERARKAASRR